MGVILGRGGRRRSIFRVCAIDLSFAGGFDSRGHFSIWHEADITEPKFEESSSVSRFAVWLIVVLLYPGNFE